MLYEEFLQTIKDSGYGDENFCIYKFTFGNFGEYVGKTENNRLYHRYQVGTSSKKVKKAVADCRLLDLEIEILFKSYDVHILRNREIQLISQLDLTTKLNIHKGGTLSDEKILRRFQNLETGEIVEKACVDMAREFKGTAASFGNLVHKRKPTLHGWCLPENYEKLKKEGTGNTKRYSFKRLSDGQEEYLGSTEMSRKYDINESSLHHLAVNRFKSAQGWCLAENYDNLIKEGFGVKCSRYKFKRVSDGFEEYLSSTEMFKKYGGVQTGYSNIANGYRKSHNGWVALQ